MTAARVFGSPSRYVQGPGEFDRLGERIAPLGTSPLVITDAVVRSLLGARLDGTLSAAGLTPEVRLLEGEITYAAVDALCGSIEGLACTPVVGVGGGKALDAAKAVALRLDRPVVTVPTIASNDSPTSSAIAMYDDTHALISVDHLPANPVLVLVDTALIASAPVDFLRAGIGDAVSKAFEVEATFAGTGVTPFGTRPLLTAAAIGTACYRVLRADAEAALADCAAGAVTPALERVVEAVVLMSGLAFENGGLSLAHSLTRGLMRDPHAQRLPHGYHVAWGTAVQLAAEERPDDEVADICAFLRATGLPASSRDLGIAAPQREAFTSIAEYTMAAPHLANFPRAVTVDLIVAACERVDSLAGGDP